MRNGSLFPFEPAVNFNAVGRNERRQAQEHTESEIRTRQACKSNQENTAPFRNFIRYFSIGT